jgi:hypothetical protein
VNHRLPVFGVEFNPLDELCETIAPLFRAFCFQLRLQGIA